MNLSSWDQATHHVNLFIHIYRSKNIVADSIVSWTLWNTLVMIFGIWALQVRINFLLSLMKECSIKRGRLINDYVSSRVIVDLTGAKIERVLLRWLLAFSFTVYVTLTIRWPTSLRSEWLSQSGAYVCGWKSCRTKIWAPSAQGG